MAKISVKISEKNSASLVFKICRMKQATHFPPSDWPILKVKPHCSAVKCATPKTNCIECKGHVIMKIMK